MIKIKNINLLFLLLITIFTDLYGYSTQVETNNLMVIKKIKETLKNKKISLVEETIPHQYIKIIEFNDKYVIIEASIFLGFKHCLYKAIEFFNSKYNKFFIKVSKKFFIDKDKIIIKFIAYKIEK